MFPDKILNTPELSAMITDFRKKHPQNGKIMSKEQVSRSMGKGRTWLSQVETGRLKKIDSEDFIKIFEIVLNVNHDTAEEEAFYFYEEYEETKINFSRILEIFCSAANDKYLSLRSTNARNALLNFFKNLYSNFIENYTDFEYLINKLDLSPLCNVDKQTQKDIHNKMDLLKKDIKYLDKFYLIGYLYFCMKKFSTKNEENSNEQTLGIKCCQDGLDLLYRLSDGCKRNLYTFEINDLDAINLFLQDVKDYSTMYYPSLKPLDMPALTTNSLNELDRLIFALRKHIQLMLQTF